ncbi:MAG: hypothetical protein FWC68_06365 [Oscillospiraceae bacterium]|nr:hypothetical protein [Oscillospiraceae bacterium]
MLLVDNGYQEMYAYSFLSKKELDKCNINDEYIKIKNPLGEDFSVMRPIMLPSMLQSLALNYSRKNKNVNLFEVGRTFLDREGKIEKEELPEEVFNISFGAYGENVDFYAVKNLVENILEVAGVFRYNLEKETSNASMHPGKTAKISVGKDIVAIFGEVHPRVTENYDISEKVYFGVVDLDKLTKYGKTNKKYTQVPKYPAIERDLAIIINEDVEVGEIAKIATKKCKNILESVEIFDIYRNEKLGENKKSVAFSLTFRDASKTLIDEEVNGLMGEIIAELKTMLGAELRK